MYIVYEAFDDDTAVLLDIPSFQRMELIEQELITFGNKNDVLGLSVSGRKLNYINAYNCLTFPTENEADDYIKYNGLSYQNKRYIQGYWYVLEKKNYKKHVDYYVCHWINNVPTYIGEKGGYTNYIQAAKKFTKDEAGKKAAMLRTNSKTGKFWTTQRVVEDRR